MSRIVTTTDIQRAIADIRVWAHDEGPKPDLLLAIAELLEQLLVQRETL